MEPVQSLVLTVITENYLTVGAINKIIQALICGTVGVTAYLAAVLAREGNGPDATLSIRRCVSVALFSTTLGYATAAALTGVLGWSAYFMIPGMIGIGVRQIANMTPKEILKVVTNIWVSVTKREKLETGDIVLESVEAQSLNKGRRPSKTEKREGELSDDRDEHRTDN